MSFSRREMLAAPLLFLPDADAATGPTIRTVEAWNAPYRVTSYFRFLPKPERPSVLLKLTCDDGTVGWGQSVPLPTWSYETPESVLSDIRDYLAPALTGKPLRDLPAIHLAMKKAIASSFSTGAPIAKAAVDLAVHDALGRTARCGLPDLWARKGSERVELSWTVNARTMTEAEHLVAEGKRNGYRHFNLKVAPDPAFDLELCRYVRSQVPEAFLWIDANGGYELDVALRVAPKFASLGVDVFEQPIAPNRLSGLGALKKQGALPIIFDEGVVSSVELEEFIRLGLLDGVAMKPARTAGLTDARRQIELLEDAGLIFLGSGLTDPDLSLAASLQLFSAYGLKHPAALNGPQFLAGSYLKKPLAAHGGFLEVPQGHGLGVDIDESRLHEISRRKS